MTDIAAMSRIRRLVGGIGGRQPAQVSAPIGRLSSIDKPHCAILWRCGQGVPGMLALTRRVGEEVVIGDPSRPIGAIRVVSIHGDKVRLSFDFPRDMEINRRELAEQKAKQAEGK